MVSLEESRSNSSRFPLARSYQYHSSVSSKTQRQIGRSMRTIRSNFFQDDNSSSCCSFTEKSTCLSENLTDSVVDLRLGELALRNSKSVKSSPAEEDLLDLSQAFSDFSACSSDISGELQRLATLPSPKKSDVSGDNEAPELEIEPCMGFLQRENFSTEIIESISPEDLQPTVKMGIDGVQSHYVLKTGTETSKQNAACALLSLALVEENKSSIGASGAIPPLVSLLLNGSSRGKKDALTTLYKLCSVRQNKERTVSAGAVKPLVELVAEQGSGMAEKAMVVLNSLAGIQEGKNAIVEEGGIAALVEAIEDGSVKGKEFAVLTLLQLCVDSVRNRGFLVREGGIPPLVALSQTGSVRAKHKAETLLRYLRESRQEAASTSSS
ncbi:U-box domain-containing protein 4 [Glycine soja]|nr:U-box domain-containing protein 4 [Glycine soja]